MDAALLAEREAFKRRAMAVPTVENRGGKKRRPEESPRKPSGAPSKPSKPALSDKERLERMKAMGASSQYKVGARLGICQLSGQVPAESSCIDWSRFLLKSCQIICVV
jgi:hypothetical protein